MCDFIHAIFSAVRIRQWTDCGWHVSGSDLLIIDLCCKNYWLLLHPFSSVVVVVHPIWMTLHDSSSTEDVPTTQHSLWECRHHTVHSADKEGSDPASVPLFGLQTINTDASGVYSPFGQWRASQLIFCFVWSGMSNAVHLNADGL